MEDPTGSDSSDGASSFKCGYVAILGRPNVGKSTLLNRLIGQKLAITSDRPQTTRHRITGIVNRPGAQILLLDSPGVQHERLNAMNRVLNRTALQVAMDADVIVQVCEANGWREADASLAKRLPEKIPRFLALNKIDMIKNKAALFKWAPEIQQEFGFEELIPVSAKSGFQTDLLADLCAGRLPIAEAVYDVDQLTDRSERFLAAELIREKLFRRLGAELPYASTVVIDSFEQEGNLRRIHATVLVQRDSQKGIVLGSKGGRMKMIASEARLDLEKLFDSKVFLEVFVKVRSGWADNEQSLRSYGYE